MRSGSALGEFDIFSYFDWSQVFTEIESRVKQSGQFTENQMEKERECAVEDMLSVWSLSVCPSNAMLGGYLANYIMFYVQRKQKPLLNFLCFDLWSCEGLEMLLRNAEDEQTAKLREREKKEKDTLELSAKCKGNGVMEVEEHPDISKLTVQGQPTGGGDQVVLLDDSDNDEDIDLID